VIARDRDPAAMTAAERLAEIAAIMAAGYVRLRAARALSQKVLDGSRGSEAQCPPRAQSPQSEDNAA